MFKVTAWEVKTDRFEGLVYSQSIILDKMAEAEWYTVERKFLYRDHRPTSHVTYEEI